MVLYFVALLTTCKLTFSCRAQVETRALSGA